MGCFILLFVAFLTISKVTSFSCSNQQPLGSASGDDFPGSQEVTTLQYCFINNCTIMTTDTGEKLDIVYTTDSLLIATPTDGHTSLIVAKLNDELPCALSTIVIDPVGVTVMVTSIILIIVTNGIALVTHLMFKELRSLFGKLLMIYNLLILCIAFSFIAVVVMLISQIGRQLIACHGLVVFITVLAAGSDMTATCMLHCLVYILYHSYIVQQISEDEFKNLFRWHLAFIFGAMFLVLFIMVSYDVGINRGAHILHGGYCTSDDVFPVNVVNISTHVSKSAQIVLFLVYLYYKYKINREARDAAVSDSQDNLLHKIAIVMGATIGMAYLLFSVYVIFGFFPALVAHWMLFFIQQYVVLAMLLCTRKMKMMCKEYFSKD